MTRLADTVAAAPAGPAIRVLVVDDHVMLADSVAAYLRNFADIDVTGVATDAAQAIATLAGTDVDVVLLDYRLPDMTGDELCGVIVRTHPHTKVVLISGTVDDEGVKRALAAGCSGFVPKGRPAVELLEAVRAVHGGAAVVSPELLGRLLPRLGGRPRAAFIGDDLTAREREVLDLLAAGGSTRTVASALHIEPTTVRNHTQNILTKLQAHSKLEAVVIAIRHGLTNTPG